MPSSRHFETRFGETDFIHNIFNRVRLNFEGKERLNPVTQKLIGMVFGAIEVSHHIPSCLFAIWILRLGFQSPYDAGIVSAVVGESNNEATETAKEGIAAQSILESS